MIAPAHETKCPRLAPWRRDPYAALGAFEEMIHNLDAVIWVAEPRTLQVLCLSRGAEYLLDYPSDPAFMDPDFLRHHIHPDDRDRVLAEIREHVARGMPFRVEYRGVTAEGREVLLRNHARIGGSRGASRRLIGVIVDATDALAAHRLAAVASARAEAERVVRALEDERAARDRFLAAVVHELRNPISSMLAAAEIVRKASPGQARFDRAVQVMERCLRLQARLIEDLTELSAAMWGQMHLRREVIDLRVVVEDVVDAQREAAEAASLSLKTDLASGVWVDGDRDRLQQAVMNLVGNAIKYTDPDGSIHVSLQSGETGFARLVVADTGIGISPELLEALFEIFRRGENTASAKPGLGIGLALVRSIAELHGGRVWAESEGLGKGSRFILELPVVPPPA